MTEATEEFSTGSGALSWSKKRAFALVLVFVCIPYIAVGLLALFVHPAMSAALLALVPATPWLYFWAAWITKFVETGEMEPNLPHHMPRRVGKT